MSSLIQKAKNTNDEQELFKIYEQWLENKQLDPLKEVLHYNKEVKHGLIFELLKKRIASNSINYLDGYIYEFLLEYSPSHIKRQINEEYPNGIITLDSSKGLEYNELQSMLLRKQFFKADRVTQQLLCELGGESSKVRGWLYFSEVINLSSIDLLTMDQLWKIHSEGKFGFSIQRNIWLAQGKNIYKFWKKIGWQNQGNRLCRYPDEFIWDLKAPLGHLPLFNQLRGSASLNALFSHPVWEQHEKK